MAALSDRWSREAARERWTELRAFNGSVLGFGIPVMALWPLVALVEHWNAYTAPWAAACIYVASIVLPMATWRRGPRGIGIGTSLAALAFSLVLSAALLSLIDDEHRPEIGTGNWITSWGAAVFFVLIFARPVEEVATSFLVFVGVTYLLDFPAHPDVHLLHNAPTRIGAVVPGVVAILAVITALRVGVRDVARSRALAAAAEQQLAVTEAVSRERADRFDSWEADVAPLLEDLTEGRQSVADPAVIARCHRLASQLRTQLSASADSLFAVLLRDEIDALRSRGGELTIQDVDVGFRLPEADRITLVGLLADVCRQPGTPIVELTLVKDDGDAAALVIFSVAGAAVPDTGGWAAARQLTDAVLSVESPFRWFWDARFTLAPAPALPAPLAWAGRM